MLVGCRMHVEAAPLGGAGAWYPAAVICGVLGMSHDYDCGHED